jgi:predicted enzyme related to lactoylglutathione lyase
MIQLRHTGLYVKNLKLETEFYKYVFAMHSICENMEMTDELLNDLFKQSKVKILFSKLLTEQGKQSGIDDMLELLQVIEPTECKSKSVNKADIYSTGRMHLGFGIEGIEQTVAKIIEKNGSQGTEIYLMNNGNKCCFCQDPEGNWLELIERKHK